MLINSKENYIFNETATTEIYSHSLHDALPILVDAVREYERKREHAESDDDRGQDEGLRHGVGEPIRRDPFRNQRWLGARSEEHTSELQSRQYLVCSLLLEKKKWFPSFFFNSEV